MNAAPVVNAAPGMNTVPYDLATAGVLWRRDLKRFWRQPSRIIGAIGQPVIFWLVIGTGLARTFQIKGSGIDYLQYFYPGVLVMVLLFGSIFASVSVIEDRQQGFLRAVLVGPGSRGALVVGKCLGSSTVALLQAALLLPLVTLAGFNPWNVDWPLLVAAMVLGTVGLTALGFAVAWSLSSIQAYHAIQMTLLMPLWIVSGAMFPPDANHPVYGWVMPLNPVAHVVSCVRHALYGGMAPAATALTSTPLLELGVVAGFAAVSLAVAVVVCQRRATL